MTPPTKSGEVSILIAEDTRIQAKMLEKNLLEHGYQVRVAENGAIALEKIREQRPTLIISDIEMPTMTGYELCKAVKSDPDLKTIPVILLSTLSEPQDIIEGLHCGADNYVTKPYDANYLIGRVAALLETPLSDADEGQQLEVTLAGKRYTVKSGRQQVLNLLISTFENAVQKNRELIETNEALTLAKEKLTRSNQELEALNQQLDTANQRMSRDLDAAATVQQSLLPTTGNQIGQAQFAWKYIPCDELAGDFLNFFPLNDRYVAGYVVDVSGHGVASSLLAVTIGRFLTPQVSSSSLLLRQGDGTDEASVTSPAEVAFELNNRFPMHEQNGLYFTMLYGVLDLETLEFRYVMAGHPPLVLLRSGGPPELLKEGGSMGIGWVEGMEFDEQTVQLSVGDRLLLYSDGVPEAMDENLNQFGDQRMLEIIELGKDQGLEDSISLLLKSVERWCRKNGPKDDVSILGLEVFKG
ncbi:MAG: SpoIIE family protein phosphatase [Gemmataceae bacterium]